MMIICSTMRFSLVLFSGAILLQDYPLYLILSLVYH